MNYLDDHIGFVWGVTIFAVAIGTGILVAEHTGVTEWFISLFA